MVIITQTLLSGHLSHHQQGAGQPDGGGEQEAGVHHRSDCSGPLWPLSHCCSASQDLQPIPPRGQSHPDFVLKISGKGKNERIYKVLHII